MALYRMTYYPEQNSYARNKITFEKDLSNYATKADLKQSAGVDTSNLAANSENSDLGRLKAGWNR